MKTAILALVLSPALVQAGVAPIPHGSCHVIANGAASDWMTDHDAIEYAKGWTMLGIESRVVCRPLKPDLTLWALRSIGAGLRMSDAFSTRRALQYHYNEEATLPMAIAGHTGTMYAYSASVVAVEWIVSDQLIKHGHSKLAKILYVGEIGIELPTLRNFTLRTH